MVLRPDWCGNCFRNFAIHSDRCVWTNQGTDSAPRASVLERVRGVVPLWGKPRHVQLHHFLWTCAQAQLAAFAICITDFDPTFCRHLHSLSEKSDNNQITFILIMSFYAISE